MNNKPQSPQSLILYSLKETVRNTINNSGLPAWMIVDSLEVIMNELRLKANNEITTEAKIYEQELQKIEGENE